MKLYIKSHIKLYITYIKHIYKHLHIYINMDWIFKLLTYHYVSCSDRNTIGKEIVLALKKCICKDILHDWQRLFIFSFLVKLLFLKSKLSLFDC